MGQFLLGVVGAAVLVGGWEMLSRALGREVTPGFMSDVLKSAQADGALWLLVIAFCVAAPMSEEVFARGFLYRGWSESSSGVPGAIVLSSLVWTSLHLQYDWFFFAEVFSIGLLVRLHALPQQIDLADHRAAWPEQSRCDGADDVAGGLRLARSATSAIAIGIVIAAKIVCSVMICANSGASPPIWRAST